MKKIILGVIIAFIVIIGGCTALMGAGISSVDQAIKDTEKEIAKNDESVNDMAKNINWEVEKTDFSTSIVGIFENTSDEVIDYIEFEYKLFGSDGTVVESSFTNESGINPGEKRKVEIFCIEDNFDKFEITAKSSVF